jgi:hypothetical protein
VKKLATIATAILLAVPAAGRATYFDSGNDYWARCSGKENIICQATAGAFLDMMNSLGYQCSAAKGIDRSQVKDVLLKFLADNPEERNYPAASLAGAAFIKAFGCTKPEKH